MPNLEEHCKHTLETYGVEGRDVHQWLDNPSRRFAGAHREFRHDSETIKLVGDIFGKIYGRAMAENIALDHIMLDHKEEIQRRNEQQAETPRAEREVIVHKTQPWRINILVVLFVFFVLTFGINLLFHNMLGSAICSSFLIFLVLSGPRIESAFRILLGYVIGVMLIVVVGVSFVGRVSLEQSFESTGWVILGHNLLWIFGLWGFQRVDLSNLKSIKERTLDVSKSERPSIMNLVSAFKSRKPKRTRTFMKWYPKNENSDVMDCEICGSRVKPAGFYMMKIPGFTIRICENCSNKFSALPV